MSMAMSRTSRRVRIVEPMQRIELLEQDADDHDRDIELVVGRIDALRAMLNRFLYGVTLAAVVGAINLVYMVAGS